MRRVEFGVRVIFGIFLAACGGGDGDGDGNGDGSNAARCIPGQSAACACTDGATGAQICLDDGTFGACVCAPASDARSAPPVEDPEVPDALGRPADAAVTPVADARVAPEPDTAVSVPDAALVADAAAAPEPDADPLGGHVFIGGWRDGVSSDWSQLPGAQGAIGLEAGHTYCRFSGSDHVCDYTEMRAAEARGEYANVPVGTTAWIQRTTPELVGGVLSAPGPGGNCNNWTFTGNHIADGEYMVFGAAGAEYFLDADTYFDGIPGPSVQPAALDCGGVQRAVFCCNALP
jgi:hypothetical protein